MAGHCKNFPAPGSEPPAPRSPRGGCILKRDLPAGGADPGAYWRPPLGEEVSLGQVCAVARALAEDYARHSGRAARALIPAQRIAEGMVYIRIAEPGAAVPSPD